MSNEGFWYMAEKPWYSTNRMLKKSGGGVLASFSPSTYHKGTPRAFTRCGLAWGKARLGARGLGG
jgi:hypothetical protein